MTPRCSVLSDYTRTRHQRSPCICFRILLHPSSEPSGYCVVPNSPKTNPTDSSVHRLPEIHLQTETKVFDHFTTDEKGSNGCQSCHRVRTLKEKISTGSKNFKLGPVDGVGGVEGVGAMMAGRTSIQGLTNFIRCVTLMITTCENQ